MESAPSTNHSHPPYQPKQDTVSQGMIDANARGWSIRIQVMHNSATDTMWRDATKMRQDVSRSAEEWQRDDISLDDLIIRSHDQIR